MLDVAEELIAAEMPLGCDASRFRFVGDDIVKEYIIWRMRVERRILVACCIQLQSYKLLQDRNSQLQASYSITVYR